MSDINNDNLNQNNDDDFFNSIMPENIPSAPDLAAPFDFSDFKLHEIDALPELIAESKELKIDLQEEKSEIESFNEHKDDIAIAQETKKDIVAENQNSLNIPVTVKTASVPLNPAKKPLIKEPVFYLETAKIKPNPYQPRRYFDEAGLQELAESIKEFGILQPLIVSRKTKEMPWGEDVEYELIAGERRLLASKLIGFERVPAIIRDNPDERLKLEMALIENIQRSDLNPIETARAFAKLIDEFGLSQKEIAQKIGKSREAVANNIRLLQLPFEVQKAIGENKITEAHARVILTAPNPEKQRALLAETLTFGFSVRELQSLADRFAPREKTEKTPSPERVRDAYLKEAEIHLANVLSLPVSINKKGQRGKIVINFASEEDFKNILNKFGIQNI